MYKVIYEDTVLYMTNSKIDARTHLFIEAEKRFLKFWQEISRYGRIDFIFYYPDDEEELDVYTIIKE